MLYKPALKEAVSGDIVSLILNKSDIASSKLFVRPIPLFTRNFSLSLLIESKKSVGFVLFAISFLIPTKMKRVLFCGTPYSEKSTRRPSTL